jgi:hypothetical protein
MVSNSKNVQQLPNEVWCMILAQVIRVNDKMKCRLLCKQLRDCVDDDLSWVYTDLEIVARGVSILLSPYFFKYV